MGYYPAIGFYLSAKGLIRYGEIKDAEDQGVAEYIFAGTMASTSVAIVVGEAVRHLIA